MSHYDEASESKSLIQNNNDNDNNNSQNKIPTQSILVAGSAMLLEYYDFALMGYFTDEVGAAFFPDGTSVMHALEVFTIYAIGFAFRPFGGALFGYIGDKWGRTTALYISIILMALPTALTGCIPTFNMIGWVAPSILILLRILQGLSCGGENASAFIYIYEVAPINKRGLWISVMVLSSAGVLVASLMHVIIVESCSTSFLYEWGWRIPFWIGFVLIFIGLYARNHLTPSKSFERLESHASTHSNPLKEAITNHPTALIQFFFASAIQHGGGYLLWTFLPDYLESMRDDYDDKYSYIINCINIVITLPIVVIIGYLVDIFGARYFALYAATVIGIISPFVFIAFSYSTSFWMDWVLQFVMATQYSILAGSIFYWYISALCADPRTRVSIYGVGYNLGAAVFSGTASLIGTFLIDIAGDRLGMLLTGLWWTCLAIFSILSIIYTEFFKQKRKLSITSQSFIDNKDSQEKNEQVTDNLEMDSSIKKHSDSGDKYGSVDL